MDFLLSFLFYCHYLNLAFLSFLAENVTLLSSMLDLQLVLTFFRILLHSAETRLICYSVGFSFLIKFSDLFVEIICLGLEGAQILCDSGTQVITLSLDISKAFVKLVVF